MKTLIAILLVCVPFGAARADEQASCHTVRVCDLPPKKAPPKKQHKKAVVVAPPAKKQQDPARVTITSPEPTTWTKKGDVVVTWKKREPADPDLVFGLHAALGLGFGDPHTSALLGARVHYKPWHLGGELYTAFDYGIAIQAMGYTYQGERLSHHVDLGVLFNNTLKLSDQDIPRTWDLTVGTGLEYKVLPFLSLTADWRMALPSPVFMGQHGGPVRDANGKQVFGQAGRYLDVGNTMGNAFGSSQFLLGVLLHNW